MDAVLSGDSLGLAWDLLDKRFPGISFLLTLSHVDSITLTQDSEGYFNGEGIKGPLYEKDIEEEISRWKGSLFLEGVDVLYIYGIGLGYYYRALQEWLKERKERVLVFFEEDLAVLQTLFSLPIGLELLKDEQVHLCYFPDSSKSSWQRLLDECVKRWISDRVDLTALVSYSKGISKKMKMLRLELLRKSTLVHVGIAELLYYHILIENIGSNFYEVPDSFHVNKLKDKFKNIPAVICGAGVSLSEAVDSLRKLDQRALIFAGGSTITALSHYGIRPHIAMALDPNDEEYLRLKGSSSFEMPFVYSSRLNKEVLSSSNIKPGYLCSDTGGVFESWMHEQLEIEPDSLGPELGMEALSVTTLAVPLARHLGCNPILFCGVDLSYRNGERYSSGVLPSSQVYTDEMYLEKRSMEKPVRRKNKEGKLIHTLIKWVMESSCIGSYVKQSKDVAFFNASFQGLPIGNVKPLSMEEFITLYCKEEYDLRGLLQVEGELSRFSHLSKEKIMQSFQNLIDSLHVCLPLLKKMIEEIESRLLVVSDLSISLESGRMSLIAMDLEEEPAYFACLQCAFVAYEKILERSYPSVYPLDTERGRQNFLEKKKKLWKECYLVAEKSLSLFNVLRRV